MTKVTMYMCAFCSEIYRKSSDQLNCEASHVSKENLEITDVDYKNNSHYHDYSNWKHGYPNKLIIENNKKSGSAAEYKLVIEGSVEDFEPYRKSTEILE